MSLFFLFTVCVPGIKHRSPSLAAITFAHWVIPLAWNHNPETWVYFSVLVHLAWFLTEPTLDLTIIAFLPKNTISFISLLAPLQSGHLPFLLLSENLGKIIKRNSITKAELFKWITHTHTHKWAEKIAAVHQECITWILHMRLEGAKQFKHIIIDMTWCSDQLK